MGISGKDKRKLHNWSVEEDQELLLEWPVATEFVRLDPGQLHLWAFAPNEYRDQVPRFQSLLSPAEQISAQKFKFAEDSNRYVVRHGLLRLILSRYLEQPPSAIEFREGLHGKPELITRDRQAALFFNTSHSAAVAVFAITSACPIGVDVERTLEIPEFDKIAEQFFLPSETRKLMALPNDSRMQSFYNCWTRKEAYLKATGEGIAESLKKVEVTLAPGEKPAVVAVSGNQGEHDRWRMHPISPAPGYLACIAYRNSDLAMHAWRIEKSAIRGMEPNKD